MSMRKYINRVSSKPANVKLKNKKSFTLLEVVFTITIIGILLAIFLPVMSAIKLNAQKLKDTANLKKIATAWYEYAVNQGNSMDLRETSPKDECSDYGIWFALSLAGCAQTTGKFHRSKSFLNDPNAYVSPSDKYASEVVSEYIARGSDNTEESDLIYNFGWNHKNNDFNAENDTATSNAKFFFSYCTIGNLDASVPLVTTPLAFTRGLKSNGTWDEKYGLYGSKGGYVVFCDGHITWFDGSKPAKFLHWNGEQYTTDIRQAIPNVAKIGNGSVQTSLTGQYDNIVIWGNGTGGD
ncbi:MAG: type II secretion system GspH family protein [Puniceicoccales bacterium]|jgi:type II secretory pathway pseudopilin PulG|nr:type II secretion system GspH family protein [Puniceicoccales bacterium]